MTTKQSLPIGWELSKIGEVCNPSQYGYTAKAVQSGRVHFLRTTDITSGYINWTTVPFCDIPEIEQEKYLLKDGDVLISRAGSVGYSYLLVNPKTAVFASYLIRFRPLINSKYFSYFLKTQDYWNAIGERSLGIAVQNVNATQLSEIALPIAPLAEQTRIVEKLEELLSDLDAGVAELKAAQKKLVQYRQSLLKAAVEGKLTQHWREQRSAPSPSPQPLSHQGRGAYGVDVVNDAAANYQPHLSGQNATSREQNPESTSATLPSPLVGEGLGERGQLQPTPPETGAQLLARILKQRRANWEAKQLAKFQQQGKTPPNGWQDKYPEPVKPDTSDLPELPEGWVWASLDQLSEFITSGSRGWAEYYSEEGAIFIRSQNINKNWLDLSDIAFVTPPRNSEGERTRIEINDLLLTITGANVGKVALVETRIEEAYVSQHVALIRPIDSTLGNYFHMFLTASSGGRGQLDKKVYGAGKPGLNLQHVKSVFVPLPPRDESNIMSEDLNIQFNAIHEQSTHITHLLKQSTAQRKNILKAAFSGQLVPQDPNDEPASVLLERIQAERATRQTAKAPKKRTTKTAS